MGTFGAAALRVLRPPFGVREMTSRGVRVTKNDQWLADCAASHWSFWYLGRVGPE